ncbi:MAG: hypothetical protein C4541_05790 [Candidatus Auribacter fodinae]|jgi:CDP-glycerol glycerophosphotransferase (TagB/SpsB family)|uniref:Uncharacterized protein n=1 Tax=Candidatus Auribacter fodinae TaxID=2093366 RepID=A0A3A4R0A3_9BACT|nr:MAG: hypothetical protein C4541_05790 [Candidatus Auribacter fodinae]
MSGPAQKLRMFLYNLKCDAVFLLGHIVPREKGLWVFGSWFGLKYWGNSRFFYEYVRRNHPEIRAVWLTRNPLVLHYLLEHGYEVYDAHSFKAVMLTLRAECCCISHNLYDINEYAGGALPVIQLRRGTPFLYVEAGEHRLKKGFFHTFRKWMRFPLYKECINHWRREFVIASSEKVKSIYEQYFRVPSANIAVTGYPRTDMLYHHNRLASSVQEKLDLIHAENGYAGIYVPHDDCESFINRADSINAELKKARITLFLKFYVRPSTENLNKLKFLSNIAIIPDDCVNDDVFPLLPSMDFFLTDYASMFLDFLLLGKPVLFTPFEKSLSFFYEYDDVAPGKKIAAWQDLVPTLKAVVSNPQEYEAQRERVCAEFHAFRDSQSCKRVFDSVIAYLKEV